MYQKYSTHALVLGSRELGESDKSFSLYTHDFGLIRARASSVRSEKSKMRSALQNYSLANVSLVKGKRGWRVAGATALRIAVGDVQGISTFARISLLTLRLVQGEEKNEYLFAALSDAHESLMQKNVELASTIEIVCVARILYTLGYISSEALESTLFSHTGYGDPHLEEATRLQDQLLLSINKAIAEAQL